MKEAQLLTPVGFLQQLVNSHMVHWQMGHPVLNKHLYISLVPYAHYLQLPTTKQPWFLSWLLVSPPDEPPLTTCQLRRHGTDVAQGICRAGLASAGGETGSCWVGECLGSILGFLVHLNNANGHLRTSLLGQD